MRLLSALFYEEIEEYIKLLPGVVLEIVKDKKSLLDAARIASYDAVLISGVLPGGEDIESLIELLSSEELNGPRIIFVYGEHDERCDGFIRFLINNEVNDFFVGAEITSRDVERLIFRPADRETAYGYYGSGYDNDIYFCIKELRPSQSKGFFNKTAQAGSVFTPLLSNGKYRDKSIGKQIISLVSNQATGKSHTAWNMACCLSKRGYATTAFNIDRGYSANLFFDIDEIYYDLLDFTINNCRHKDILDNCFKSRKVSVITGRLGDENEIGEDDFIKLLYGIRTKSDITIIDTRTGISALTRSAIKSSTYDLLVFDCDIMHFHMNMKMLEELKDEFVPEKTIAVINNTSIKSSSHKFIYNELINTGIPFKDITAVASCGFLSSEVMHTGLSPYETAGDSCKAYKADVELLADKLCGRSARSGLFNGIFGNKR